MFKLVVGHKTVTSKNNTNFSLKLALTTESCAPRVCSRVANDTVSVPRKPCVWHKTSMFVNSPSSVAGNPDVCKPKIYPTCSCVRSTKSLFSSKHNYETLILSIINRHSWWSNFTQHKFNNDPNPNDWTTSFFGSSKVPYSLHTRCGAHLLFNFLVC